MPVSPRNGRLSLIDDWFPISEVGIESVRERSASSALPPLYFLHVWFARRPLATSRATILTTILPPTADKRKALRLLGIPPDKDIARASKLIQVAKAQKKKLATNPFSWERAYKHTPSAEELSWLGKELESFWGARVPTILDPMAGGGSIPYEAVRLGLPVKASDLNPVAYIVLKATVEYPSKFGVRLIPAVKEFCKKIGELALDDLSEFYPKSEGEKIHAYLWCRTVKCQHCGMTIPLSPNWWISRTDNERLAVRPIPTDTAESCYFEEVSNPEKRGYDPEKGTDVGKEARCPNTKTCGKVNEGTYIKAEGQAGRLGHQLFMVCTKTKGSAGSSRWKFRFPTEAELMAVENAGKELQRMLPDWSREGLVPNEDYSKGFSDRCYVYGFRKWFHFFNSRQLLTHVTYLAKFKAARKELFAGLVKGTPEYEFAEAVITYGAMVFDTCVNYNCVLSRWRPDRLVVSGLMDTQAFPFKTSYAEWDHPTMLWSWATAKTIDSLTQLIGLLPANRSSVEIFHGDAAQIPESSEGVDCIVVDPPYAENVMYSEVMNFFYVWLKRMLRDNFPDTFRGELTDSHEEAVANSSLFRDASPGMAKKLADQHYQSKMEACFKDMHRVLRDDGVMTVMFTHRKAEAWASLASSLMKAGFTFRASWPVFTEPGEKFGKREKGVLKVTVLLACQKRLEEKRGLWEEIHRELREEAESKVKEHNKLGIVGPDLLVSAYGPVLGKFADYFIVKDSTGRIKGPEDALNVVAEAVNRFLTADLPSADLETVAYLNLVRNFPYLETEVDFARVVTVFGGNVSLDTLDVKGGSGLVEKQGNKVRVLTALDRAEGGIIVPTKVDTLRSLIDAVHASLIIYEKMGVQAVKNLLVETGRDSSDSGFLGVLRVIAQVASNDGAAKALIDEGRTANALLEALGHQPETTHQKGESLTHYMDS